ncbi:hypothetical protein [Chamaesiphon sp.]
MNYRTKINAPPQCDEALIFSSVADRSSGTLRSTDRRLTVNYSKPKSNP